MKGLELALVPATKLYLNLIADYGGSDKDLLVVGEKEYKKLLIDEFKGSNIKLEIAENEEHLFDYLDSATYPYLLIVDSEIQKLKDLFNYMNNKLISCHGVLLYSKYKSITSFIKDLNKICTRIGVTREISAISKDYVFVR